MTACWSSMSHSAMGNLESTVQNNALRLLNVQIASSAAFTLCSAGSASWY